MFRGVSSHILDDKGRIVIPARFRDTIRANGDEAVMITCMDQSLFAYPLLEWGKIEKNVLSAVGQNNVMRRFRRVFVGGACECGFDKQSRVLIPPSLREYAQLEKNIVMVGLGTYFEIWALDRWETENKLLEQDLTEPEVRQAISKLGL